MVAGLEPAHLQELFGLELAAGLIPGIRLLYPSSYAMYNYYMRFLIKWLGYKEERCRMFCTFTVITLIQ